MLQGFELGWIVGLLDGEGCFGAYQDKRRPTTWAVKVQMECTDLDTVEKLNELVPGRIWESTYPSRTKNFPVVKRSWRWAISDKTKVKELCSQILPYMCKRRQTQIEFVLTHCEYKRKKQD